MNVSINHNAVTHAADQMRSAAYQITKVEPEIHLADIAEALPGSSSGGAAASCGEHWRSDLDAWHKNARSYAELMKQCADNYQVVDLETQASPYHEYTPRNGEELGGVDDPTRVEPWLPFGEKPAGTVA